MEIFPISDIADEDLEEIEIAREVIGQIQSLQGRLPKDATPAQEAELAAELRDVAASFSDRLKAFAALWSWYRKSHARLKCTLPPSVPIPPRFVLPTFKTHGVRIFYERQLMPHRIGSAEYL